MLRPATPSKNFLPAAGDFLFSQLVATKSSASLRKEEKEIGEGREALSDSSKKWARVVTASLARAVAFDKNQKKRSEWSTAWGKTYQSFTTDSITDE